MQEICFYFFYNEFYFWSSLQHKKAEIEKIRNLSAKSWRARSQNRRNVFVVHHQSWMCCCCVQLMTIISLFSSSHCIHSTTQTYHLRDGSVLLLALLLPFLWNLIKFKEAYQVCCELSYSSDIWENDNRQQSGKYKKKRVEYKIINRHISTSCKEEVYDYNCSSSSNVFVHKQIKFSSLLFAFTSENHHFTASIDADVARGEGIKVKHFMVQWSSIAYLNISVMQPSFANGDFEPVSFLFNFNGLFLGCDWLNDLRF